MPETTTQARTTMFPTSDSWLPISVNGARMYGRLSGLLMVSEAPDGRAVLHVPLNNEPPLTVDAMFEDVCGAIAHRTQSYHLARAVKLGVRFVDMVEDALDDAAAAFGSLLEVQRTMLGSFTRLMDDAPRIRRPKFEPLQEQPSEAASKRRRIVTPSKAAAS